MLVMRAGDAGRIECVLQRLADRRRRHDDELVDPDMMVADLRPIEDQFLLAAVEVPEIAKLERGLGTVDCVEAVAGNEPEAVGGKLAVRPQELDGKELVDARFEALDDVFDLGADRQAEGVVKIQNWPLRPGEFDFRGDVSRLERPAVIRITRSNSNAVVSCDVDRSYLLDVAVQGAVNLTVKIAALVAEKIDHTQFLKNRYPTAEKKDASQGIFNMLRDLVGISAGGLPAAMDIQCGLSVSPEVARCSSMSVFPTTTMSRLFVAPSMSAG